MDDFDGPVNKEGTMAPDSATAEIESQESQVQLSEEEKKALLTEAIEKNEKLAESELELARWFHIRQNEFNEPTSCGINDDDVGKAESLSQPEPGSRPSQQTCEAGDRGERRLHRRIGSSNNADAISIGKNRKKLKWRITARNSLFHPLGSLPAEGPGSVGGRREFIKTGPRIYLLGRKRR